MTSEQQKVLEFMARELFEVTLNSIELGKHHNNETIFNIYKDFVNSVNINEFVIQHMEKVLLPRKQ